DDAHRGPGESPHGQRERRLAAWREIEVARNQRPRGEAREKLGVDREIEEPGVEREEKRQTQEEEPRGDENDVAAPGRGGRRGRRGPELSRQELRADDEGGEDEDIRDDRPDPAAAAPRNHAAAPDISSMIISRVSVSVTGIHTKRPAASTARRSATRIASSGSSVSQRRPLPRSHWRTSARLTYSCAASD